MDLRGFLFLRLAIVSESLVREEHARREGRHRGRVLAFIERMHLKRATIKTATRARKWC